MAQERTKQFNEKVNLMGDSILHLRAHLRFPFTEHLKMHKIIKKKMHFMLQLMIHLTVSSKDAPEGTFDGASKDALRDLHKDAQKGAWRLH